MKKRSLPKNSTREKIRRDRDPVPWRYCLLTLCCGVLLVAGFFFAARQHFSSIDFGIKNSSLKKQIEELEAEKRRLLLMKEIALSPAEIKKAAKKLGLSEMTASNIEVTRPVLEKTAKTPDEKKKPLPTDKSPLTKADEKPVKNEIRKDKTPVVKKATKEKTGTQVARN